MKLFTEYQIMVESEQITSVPQAVEIIANLIKTKAGIRGTKLKNYGYYSFAVKDTSFPEKLKTAFSTDSRFTLKELNSYLEYSILVKDAEFKFKLKYESSKSNSKLVLSLDFD